MYFILFPLLDLLIVAFAIMFSYKIYRVMGIGYNVYYAKLDIVPFSFLCAFVTVLVMYGTGVYKSESSLLNVEEIKNVLKGVTLSFFVINALLFFGKIWVSRYVLAFSYIFSMVFIVIEKMVFYHMLPSMRPIQGLHKKILIYGAGELGQAVFKEIANSPKFRIIPVGFIDDDPRKGDFACYQSGFNCEHCLRVLGGRKDIDRIVKEHDIDEIYIAITNIDPELLMEIIAYLDQFPVKVAFVPNLYRLFLHRISFQKVGNIPIIREEEYETRLVYPYLKRIFDMVLAGMILLVTWPLFLIIAIAIKKDSPGPVFFKHERVGKNGAFFMIYKFRSMYTNSNPHAVNPMDAKDPRVTPVGRFLRKTSLDELPQLINVLKGEMSFVGPRPEMPFIVAYYNDIQKERLRNLPGITGLWQLSGDRKKAIHENMDYDLYYNRNMSFFLDLAILIETLFFAFKGI